MHRVAANPTDGTRTTALGRLLRCITLGQTEPRGAAERGPPPPSLALGPPAETNNMLFESSLQLSQACLGKTSLE